MTPLGETFSTAENAVLQCDNQTLRSTAETLVIQFDYEKFEQLLSRGSVRSLNMRKHGKISLARAPLVAS